MDITVQKNFKFIQNIEVLPLNGQESKGQSLGSKPPGGSWVAQWG